MAVTDEHCGAKALWIESRREGTGRVKVVSLPAASRAPFENRERCGSLRCGSANVRTKGVPAPGGRRRVRLLHGETQSPRAQVAGDYSSYRGMHFLQSRVQGSS